MSETWTNASSTPEAWSDSTAANVGSGEAFQPTAFQNNAFQVGYGWTVPSSGTEVWTNE